MMIDKDREDPHDGIYGVVCVSDLSCVKQTHNTTKQQRHNFKKMSKEKKQNKNGYFAISDDE